MKILVKNGTFGEFCCLKSNNRKKYKIFDKKNIEIDSKKYIKIYIFTKTTKLP